MLKRNNSLRLRTYEAGLLQAKAHRNLTNFMSAALEPHGVSLPQWALLGLISEQGELRPTTIAQHLGVKPPVATALLRELKKMGLIIREKSTADNRSIVVHLTNEGSAKVSTVETELRGAMKQYLKGIKIRELNTYIDVLTKIAAK